MELNYKEFGQGEPIIILHGLFGMLDNWQTIAKRLANDYWIFVVDQRNHGKSPHVNGLSYPLMAQDLKAFMDQHWIPQAHIIGHSMGGKTAMQFAFEYPDMVDKLVVLDIAPPANESGHGLIFDALHSVDLQKIETRIEADEKLAQKIKDYGVRQFLLKNLSRQKEGGYRWKMNLEAISNNYDNILAAVEGDYPYDGESLFIRGGKSDYIMEREADVIKKLFTDTDIKTIDRAGHWVHADEPALLMENLRQFLE